MMLQLHLDDSGNEDRDVIVVVGGCLASEAQWTAFEEAWNAMMAEKQVKYWTRLSDALARKKAFAGFSSFKQAAALQALLPLVPRYTEFRVGNASNVNDFNRIMAPAGFHRATGAQKFNILAYNVYVVLLQTSTRWFTTPPNERVAIVIEEGSKGHDEMMRFCRFLIDKVTWAKIFAGPVPAPKGLPGLRAADVIANVTFRSGLRHLKPMTRLQLKRRSKREKDTQKWDLLATGDVRSRLLGYTDAREFSRMVAQFAPVFRAFEAAYGTQS